jgi:hypothetical protein
MSKAEKFIQDYTSNCYNYNSYAQDPIPWLTPDQARRAVEIAREEELEYVKYQLDLRLPETLDYNGVQVNREDFIKEFVKAIRDE